jgi:hypothetical protein
MGRKRSGSGARYGAEGGIAAFTLLIGLIVMLVLAAAYTVNTTKSDLASASIGGKDRLVSAQRTAATKPTAAQVAQARARARARYVARIRQRVYRVKARRAAGRRAAARRAVMRSRRATETVTVTYVDVPATSAYRSTVAHDLCGRLPRGGGRAGRRARAVRRARRAETLRELGLHC